MNAIILEAVKFATIAHGQQVRKYTGEPYVAHCIEVAQIVEPYATDVEMICAAILHDTIEDTAVTYSDLESHFGREIASLVDWLTDISEPKHGNRMARKAIDRGKIALSPARAQTIKLADIISNTKSIVSHDPRFSKIYLQEKRLLLQVLDKGDRDLWEIAASQCNYQQPNN